MQEADLDDLDILLVEDNRNEAELTLRVFRKKLTQKIHVVRDGAEALDFLFCSGPYAQRKPDKSPKVILLDLKIPKINGLEVLQRIKADEKTRMIPVVILTSSMQDQDMVRAYKNGANS